MSEQLETDGPGAGSPQIDSLLKSPYRGSAAWADSASEPTPNPSWRWGLASQCWITGWSCWLRRDKEKMWAIPVIVRPSTRQRSWGECTACVLRAVLIQSCLTVAQAAECHFAKQLYAESEVGPVSNSSKVNRTWWKIMCLPLILPICQRGKPSPEGWNIIAQFSYFRIFLFSITWLEQVAVSAGDPQFGQVDAGIHCYSQWYWHWKIQMPPLCE